ncbi:hypothetical protein [Terrabacter sp. 2YAF2]|uniref:hypothetical protein n=1 Tax=Terrabacter sp. 2YAF2 TaxID=3233026 RepID=UPI003F96ABA7
MGVHITSGDLDEWSRRRDSEGHLPTLVRRLIMASVRPDWIRMPAAEGVAQPGLDGIITISSSTHPYVPVGDSVWEIGTKQSQRAKAIEDYAKRTDETRVEVRRNTTYVAVTNRRWSEGDTWIADMKARGDQWKEITVLTADELAIWLEDCLGPEGWLREHLGKGSLGDISLPDWFARWSRQTQPATPDASLTAGRRKDVTRLLDTLDAPSAEAFTVAASSVEEGVAFIAAALRLGPDPLPKDPTTTEADDPEPDPDVRTPEHLEALRERAIVIADEAGWRRWSIHRTPHVLIPLFIPDSIGDAIDLGHHVVLPTVARTAHDKGRLQPLDPLKAAEAWRETGIDFYKAHDYALAGRRNLGTLRRRLNRHGHQTPAWASGADAPLLASALLAGAWNADRGGDREVLLALTRHTNWPGLIKAFTALATGEDPPLGLLGEHWDFVDIVDAWDAIGSLVTPDDLVTFTEAVKDALLEPDPDAALTAEERLKLSLDDTRPRRRYSHALRRGLATTLALLGSNTGDHIAAGTVTGQQAATRIVSQLLDDADEHRWFTLAGELQLLAEAAPDAFLHAVESSLRAEEPSVVGLFNEKKDLLTTRSPHVSLLWALETLAFSPTHVARVAIILARLAVLDPGGTLNNRPAASVVSVLSLLRPDGAINAENRIDVLDAVIAAVPEHATALIKGLVESRGGGIVNVGPRYRDWPNDRHHATSAEYQAALTELCTRLLVVTSAHLSDVAGLLSRFSSVDMARILDMLTARWAELDEPTQAQVLTQVAEDVDKHRRYSTAHWAMPEADLKPIEHFLEAHGFDLDAAKDEALFNFAADVDDHRANPRATGTPRKTVDERRRGIVRALLTAGGIESVTAFARGVEVPGYVGKALADIDTDESLDHSDQVLDLLPDGSTPGTQPGSEVAWGYAQRRSINSSWLTDQVTNRPDQAAVLLGTLPISASVIDTVNGLEEHQRALFWKRANPYRVDGDAVDAACEGFLSAGRPFSATVAAAAPEEPGPSTDVIVKVLSADLETTEEPTPDYHGLSYSIGVLLDRLERLGTDDETISRLEYYFLPVLDDYREPRSLHRELARKPELFATAVSNVYKTDDQPDTDAADALDGTGTSGMTDEQFRFSDASFRLLHGWHGPLPGTTTPGEPPTTGAVQAWVDQVRHELAALDRNRVTSVVIGEALAAPLTDADGTWPCEAVRYVIEHEKDDDLDLGLRMNRMNQRGVYSRTMYAGGGQEREIAASYRKHADKVRNRWPRTGAMLDRLAQAYDDDGRREDRDAERHARRG